MFDNYLDRFAVLYAICDEQAKEMKVGPKDFGVRLQGGFMEGATLALLGELQTFYQDHELKYLTVVMEKMIPLYEIGQRELDEQISSGQVSRILDSQLGRISPHGNGYSDSQPLQESHSGT